MTKIAWLVRVNEEGSLRRLSLVGVLLFFLTSNLSAGEISGEAGFEFRAFANSPLDTEQGNGNFSNYIQPEYYHAWDNDKQSLRITPFLRLDQNDEERTHFDVRELSWEIARQSYELRAGLSKVFWGVAETQHLIDIINQTDQVENFDGEDKLGQPMVNFALIQQWGTINLFVLPGFRERTFPSREGRPRTSLWVDTDQTRYQSGDEEKHIDLAARYSHYIGPIDFGVAHFTGTGREPTFLIGTDGVGNSVLIPRYVLIDQTSLDFQYTYEGWLFKFEGLTRSGQGDRYYSYVGGFEYTLVGIFQTAADLGILSEYHYDDRHEQSTNPLEDDIFVGGRLTLNDVQSTELLSGLIKDGGSSSYSYFVEASRRFRQSWVISLEGRGFTSDSRSDPVYQLRKDDYLQIDIAYHY